MEFTAKMLEEGSKLEDEYDFDCDGDCTHCPDYEKCISFDLDSK